MDEGGKLIRKKLVILFKIRIYAYRIAFPFIKEGAIARFKRLGKDKIMRV
jgi:hypothetical protein